LSPCNALAGMQATFIAPSPAANARYSLLIRSKAVRSQPIMSILLPTTTPADYGRFVDDPARMANAEQRDDMAVAPGLREHPVAGVDHQHCDVGRRGAGYQITGVLLVAGCIGDDERAPGRSEVAVADVDGAALLTVRLHPGRQECH